MKIEITNSNGIKQELETTRIVVKDGQGNEIILIGESGGVIWELRAGDPGADKYLRSKEVKTLTC